MNADPQVSMEQEAINQGNAVAFSAGLEPPRVPQVIAPTPAHMLATAVERGASMETLERLIALQERMEQNEARKAYTAAMAKFKANPIDIRKNKQVLYKNSKGDMTEYWHSTLDQICTKVNPILSAENLSYRWITQQGDGGIITVRCVVTHAQGHCEESVLSGSPDSSGGKNNIQAVGSTVKYLQRYTLLSVLGLSDGDEENDGAGGEKGTEEQIVTTEELTSLNKEIDEVTTEKTRTQYVKKLCEFAKVESLEELPLGMLAEVRKVVENRRTNMKKKGGDNGAEQATA